MPRIVRALAAVLATAALGFVVSAGPALTDGGSTQAGPPRCCVT